MWNRVPCTTCDAIKRSSTLFPEVKQLDKEKKKCDKRGGENAKGSSQEGRNFEALSSHMGEFREFQLNLRTKARVLVVFNLQATSQYVWFCLARYSAEIGYTLDLHQTAFLR